MSLRARLAARDRRLSERIALALEGRAGLRRTAMLLAHSGDSPLWLGGLLLVWVWPGLAGGRATTLLDLAGIAPAATVVQLIKWRVRRPRPPGEWGQGYRRLDPHSFPSGHAARAVLLAVLALVSGPPVWAALLVVWGPSVALARVGLRVHFLSDVIVGAACGLACSLALAAWAPATLGWLARF